ncbi:Hypothetical_protein [Hexamita inflata]|uniref:Hypothetical_protein n=1 Tax=Hexamita inflata TaxID=28002 RepID=A0AA86Q3J5_9EUKA|nr:Hypothetical protein HINF_LOCUS39170 [Hexamita inflata]
MEQTEVKTADKIVMTDIIMSTSKQLNQCIGRFATLKQTVSNANFVDEPMEMEANQLDEELTAMKTRFDELMLMEQIYYFDSNTFVEEGISHEDIAMLGSFCETTRKVIIKTINDLHNFMDKINAVMQENRLKYRTEELKKHTTETAQVEVNEKMEELVEQTSVAVQQLIVEQNETKIILEKGDMNGLQTAVETNNQDLKEATKEVKKARAALKRNKDTIYLLSALIMLAALIVLLVLVRK